MDFTLPEALADRARKLAAYAAEAQSLTENEKSVRAGAAEAAAQMWRDCLAARLVDPLSDGLLGTVAAWDVLGGLSLPLPWPDLTALAALPPLRGFRWLDRCLQSDGESALLALLPAQPFATVQAAFTAKPRGDGWSVTGHCSAGVGVAGAQWVLGWAETDAPHGSILLFAVHQDDPGVAVSKQHTTLSRFTTADVLLSQVSVSKENGILLASQAELGLIYAALALADAARCTGLAARCLDLARAAGDRPNAFGLRPLDGQGAAFALAESAMAIYAMRAMTYAAASKVPEGEDFVLEALAARLQAIVSTGKIVAHTRQVLAAAGGVIGEVDWFNSLVQSLEIHPLTTHQVRSIVGERLHLGQFLWERY